MSGLDWVFIASLPLTIVGLIVNRRIKTSLFEMNKGDENFVSLNKEQYKEYSILNDYKLFRDSIL